MLLLLQVQQSLEKIYGLFWAGSKEASMNTYFFSYHNTIIFIFTLWLTQSGQTQKNDTYNDETQKSFVHCCKYSLMTSKLLKYQNYN
jgi:hypothetical protein